MFDWVINMSLNLCFDSSRIGIGLLLRQSLTYCCSLKKNTKIFHNFMEIIDFSLFFMVISVEFEAVSS